MKISEYDIESKVVKYARDKGVLVVKQTHVGGRSHPDRAFYFSRGRLLQIEFKALGAKPTTLQAVTIKKLIGLGFIELLIDDIIDGKFVVDVYLTNGYIALEYTLKTQKICDKVLAKKHKSEPKVVHGRFIKR